MARRPAKGGTRGPPEWDISNRAYVKGALERQNSSRRKEPVYFSEWEKTGKFMNSNNRLKSRLYREADKIVSDLRGELRKTGSDRARKVANKLYVQHQAGGGWYSDRPFLHIAEREVDGEDGFWMMDFRSKYSDNAWSRYMSERATFENRFGRGKFPSAEKESFQDQDGIREAVIDRYFQRNPEAVRYGTI